MLKSKNSIQLLRNGTGSECNTDKGKRAVAEVPPLVRASVKGKEVTDSHVTTGELTGWKSEVSSDLGKEEGEEKSSCPENRQGKSGTSQPQISVAGLTDEERLELPLIEGLREGTYDYDGIKQIGLEDDNDYDGIKYIGLEDDNVKLATHETDGTRHTSRTECDTDHGNKTKVVQPGKGRGPGKGRRPGEGRGPLEGREIGRAHV